MYDEFLERYDEFELFEYAHEREAWEKVQNKRFSDVIRYTYKQKQALEYNHYYRDQIRQDPHVPSAHPKELVPVIEIVDDWRGFTDPYVKHLNPNRPDKGLAEAFDEMSRDFPREDSKLIKYFEKRPGYGLPYARYYAESPFSHFYSGYNKDLDMKRSLHQLETDEGPWELPKEIDRYLLQTGESFNLFIPTFNVKLIPDLHVTKQGFGPSYNPREHLINLEYTGYDPIGRVVDTSQRRMAAQTREYNTPLVWDMYSYMGIPQTCFNYGFSSYKPYIQKGSEFYLRCGPGIAQENKRYGALPADTASYWKITVKEFIPREDITLRELRGEKLDDSIKVIESFESSPHRDYSELHDSISAVRSLDNMLQNKRAPGVEDPFLVRELFNSGLFKRAQASIRPIGDTIRALVLPKEDKLIHLRKLDPFYAMKQRALLDKTIERTQLQLLNDDEENEFEEDAIELDMDQEDINQALFDVQLEHERDSFASNIRPGRRWEAGEVRSAVMLHPYMSDPRTQFSKRYHHHPAVSPEDKTPAEAQAHPELYGYRRNPKFRDWETFVRWNDPIRRPDYRPGGPFDYASPTYNEYIRSHDPKQVHGEFIPVVPGQIVPFNVMSRLKAPQFHQELRQQGLNIPDASEFTNPFPPQKPTPATLVSELKKSYYYPSMTDGISGGPGLTGALPLFDHDADRPSRIAQQAEDEKQQIKKVLGDTYGIEGFSTDKYKHGFMDTLTGEPLPVREGHSSYFGDQPPTIHDVEIYEQQTDRDYGANHQALKPFVFRQTMNLDVLPIKWTNDHSFYWDRKTSKLLDHYMRPIIRKARDLTEYRYWRRNMTRLTPLQQLLNNINMDSLEVQGLEDDPDQPHHRYFERLREFNENDPPDEENHKLRDYLAFKHYEWIKKEQESPINAVHDYDYWKKPVYSAHGQDRVSDNYSKEEMTLFRHFKAYNRRYRGDYRIKKPKFKRYHFIKQLEKDRSDAWDVTDPFDQILPGDVDYEHFTNMPDGDFLISDRDTLYENELLRFHSYYGKYRDILSYDPYDKYYLGSVVSSYKQSKFFRFLSRWIYVWNKTKQKVESKLQSLSLLQDDINAWSHRLPYIIQHKFNRALTNVNNALLPICASVMPMFVNITGYEYYQKITPSGYRRTYRRPNQFEWTLDHLPFRALFNWLFPMFETQPPKSQISDFHLYDKDEYNKKLPPLSFYARYGRPYSHFVRTMLNIADFFTLGFASTAYKHIMYDDIIYAQQRFDRLPPAKRQLYQKLFDHFKNPIRLLTTPAHEHELSLTYEDYYQAISAPLMPSESKIKTDLKQLPYYTYAPDGTPLTIVLNGHPADNDLPTWGDMDGFKQKPQFYADNDGNKYVLDDGKLFLVDDSTPEQRLEEQVQEKTGAFMKSAMDILPYRALDMSDEYIHELERFYDVLAENHHIQETELLSPTERHLYEEQRYRLYFGDFEAVAKELVDISDQSAMIQYLSSHATQMLTGNYQKEDLVFGEPLPLYEYRKSANDPYQNNSIHIDNVQWLLSKLGLEGAMKPILQYLRRMITFTVVNWPRAVNIYRDNQEKATNFIKYDVTSWLSYIYSLFMTRYALPLVYGSRYANMSHLYESIETLKYQYLRHTNYTEQYKRFDELPDDHQKLLTFDLMYFLYAEYHRLMTYVSSSDDNPLYRAYKIDWTPNTEAIKRLTTSDIQPFDDFEYSRELAVAETQRYHVSTFIFADKLRQFWKTHGIRQYESLNENVGHPSCYNANNYLLPMEMVRNNFVIDVIHSVLHVTNILIDPALLYNLLSLDAFSEYKKRLDDIRLKHYNDIIFRESTRRVASMLKYYPRVIPTNENDQEQEKEDQDPDSQHRLKTPYQLFKEQAAIRLDNIMKAQNEFQTRLDLVYNTDALPKRQSVVFMDWIDIKLVDDYFQYFPPVDLWSEDIFNQVYEPMLWVLFPDNYRPYVIYGRQPESTPFDAPPRDSQYVGTDTAGIVGGFDESPLNSPSPHAVYNAHSNDQRLATHGPIFSQVLPEIEYWIDIIDPIVTHYKTFEYFKDVASNFTLQTSIHEFDPSRLKEDLEHVGHHGQFSYEAKSRLDVYLRHKQRHFAHAQMNPSLKTEFSLSADDWLGDSKFKELLRLAPRSYKEKYGYRHDRSGVIRDTFLDEDTAILTRDRSSSPEQLEYIHVQPQEYFKAPETITFDDVRHYSGTDDIFNLKEYLPLNLVEPLRDLITSYLYDFLEKTAHENLNHLRAPYLANVETYDRMRERGGLTPRESEAVDATRNTLAGVYLPKMPPTTEQMEEIFKHLEQVDELTKFSDDDIPPMVTTIPSAQHFDDHTEVFEAKLFHYASLFTQSYEEYLQATDFYMQTVPALDPKNFNYEDIMSFISAQTHIKYLFNQIDVYFEKMLNLQFADQTISRAYQELANMRYADHSEYFDNLFLEQAEQTAFHDAFAEFSMNPRKYMTGLSHIRNFGDFLVQQIPMLPGQYVTRDKNGQIRLYNTWYEGMDELHAASQEWASDPQNNGKLSDLENAHINQQLLNQMPLHREQLKRTQPIMIPLNHLSLDTKTGEIREKRMELVDMNLYDDEKHRLFTIPVDEDNKPYLEPTVSEVMYAYYMYDNMPFSEKFRLESEYVQYKLIELRQYYEAILFEDYLTSKPAQESVHNRDNVNDYKWNNMESLRRKYPELYANIPRVPGDSNPDEVHEVLSNRASDRTSKAHALIRHHAPHLARRTLAQREFYTRAMELEKEKAKAQQELGRSQLSFGRFNTHNAIIWNRVGDEPIHPDDEIYVHIRNPSQFYTFQIFNKNVPIQLQIDQCLQPVYKAQELMHRILPQTLAAYDDHFVQLQKAQDDEANKTKGLVTLPPKSVTPPFPNSRRPAPKLSPSAEEQSKLVQKGIAPATSFSSVVAQLLENYDVAKFLDDDYRSSDDVFYGIDPTFVDYSFVSNPQDDYKILIGSNSGVSPAGGALLAPTGKQSPSKHYFASQDVSQQPLHTLFPEYQDLVSEMYMKDRKQLSKMQSPLTQFNDHYQMVYNSRSLRKFHKLPAFDILAIPGSEEQLVRLPPEFLLDMEKTFSKRYRPFPKYHSYRHEQLKPFTYHDAHRYSVLNLDLSHVLYHDRHEIYLLEQLSKYNELYKSTENEEHIYHLMTSQKKELDKAIDVEAKIHDLLQTTTRQREIINERFFGLPIKKEREPTFIDISFQDSPELQAVKERFQRDAERSLLNTSDNYALFAYKLQQQKQRLNAHKSLDTFKDVDGNFVFFDSFGEPLYYDLDGNPGYKHPDTHQIIFYDVTGRRVDHDEHGNTIYYDHDGTPIDNPHSQYLRRHPNMPLAISFYQNHKHFHAATNTCTKPFSPLHIRSIPRGYTSKYHVFTKNLLNTKQQNKSQPMIIDPFGQTGDAPLLNDQYATYDERDDKFYHQSNYFQHRLNPGRKRVIWDRLDDSYTVPDQLIQKPLEPSLGNNEQDQKTMHHLLAKLKYIASAATPRELLQKHCPIRHHLITIDYKRIKQALERKQKPLLKQLIQRYNLHQHFYEVGNTEYVINSLHDNYYQQHIYLKINHPYVPLSSYVYTKPPETPLTEAKTSPTDATKLLRDSLKPAMLHNHRKIELEKRKEIQKSKTGAVKTDPRHQFAPTDAVTETSLLTPLELGQIVEVYHVKDQLVKRLNHFKLVIPQLKRRIETIGDQYNTPPALPQNMIDDSIEQHPPRNTELTQRLEKVEKAYKRDRELYEMVREMDDSHFVVQPDPHHRLFVPNYHAFAKQYYLNPTYYLINRRNRQFYKPKYNPSKMLTWLKLHMQRRQERRILHRRQKTRTQYQRQLNGLMYITAVQSKAVAEMKTTRAKDLLKQRKKLPYRQSLSNAIEIKLRAHDIDDEDDDDYDDDDDDGESNQYDIYGYYHQQFDQDDEDEYDDDDDYHDEESTFGQPLNQKRFVPKNIQDKFAAHSRSSKYASSPSSRLFTLPATQVNHNPPIFDESDRTSQFARNLFGATLEDVQEPTEQAADGPNNSLDDARRDNEYIPHHDSDRQLSLEKKSSISPIDLLQQGPKDALKFSPFPLVSIDDEHTFLGEHRKTTIRDMIKDTFDAVWTRHRNKMEKSLLKYDYSLNYTYDDLIMNYNLPDHKAPQEEKGIRHRLKTLKTEKADAVDLLRESFITRSRENIRESVFHRINTRRQVDAVYDARLKFEAEEQFEWHRQYARWKRTHHIYGLIQKALPDSIVFDIDALVNIHLRDDSLDDLADFDTLTEEQLLKKHNIEVRYDVKGRPLYSIAPSTATLHGMGLAQRDADLALNRSSPYYNPKLAVITEASPYRIRYEALDAELKRLITPFQRRQKKSYQVQKQLDRIGELASMSPEDLENAIQEKELKMVELQLKRLRASPLDRKPILKKVGKKQAEELMKSATDVAGNPIVDKDGVPIPLQNRNDENAEYYLRFEPNYPEYDESELGMMGSGKDPHGYNESMMNDIKLGIVVPADKNNAVNSISLNAEEALTLERRQKLKEIRRRQALLDQEKILKARNNPDRLRIGYDHFGNPYDINGIPIDNSVELGLDADNNIINMNALLVDQQGRFTDIYGNVIDSSLFPEPPEIFMDEHGNYMDTAGTPCNEDGYCIDEFGLMIYDDDDSTGANTDGEPHGRPVHVYDVYFESVAQEFRYLARHSRLTNDNSQKPIISPKEMSQKAKFLDRKIRQEKQKIEEEQSEPVKGIESIKTYNELLSSSNPSKRSTNVFRLFGSRYDEETREKLEERNRQRQANKKRPPLGSLTEGYFDYDPQSDANSGATDIHQRNSSNLFPSDRDNFDELEASFPKSGLQVLESLEDSLDEHALLLDEYDIESDPEYQAILEESIDDFYLDKNGQVVRKPKEQIPKVRRQLQSLDDITNPLSHRTQEEIETLVLIAESIIKEEGYINNLGQYVYLDGKSHIALNDVGQPLTIHDLDFKTIRDEYYLYSDYRDQIRKFIALQQSQEDRKKLRLEKQKERILKRREFQKRLVEKRLEEQRVLAKRREERQQRKQSHDHSYHLQQREVIFNMTKGVVPTTQELYVLKRSILDKEYYNRIQDRKRQILGDHIADSTAHNFTKFETPTKQTISDLPTPPPTPPPPNDPLSDPSLLSLLNPEDPHFDITHDFITHGFDPEVDTNFKSYKEQQYEQHESIKVFNKFILPRTPLVNQVLARFPNIFDKLPRFLAQPCNPLKESEQKQQEETIRSQVVKEMNEKIAQSKSDLEQMIKGSFRKVVAKVNGTGSGTPENMTDFTTPTSFQRSFTPEEQQQIDQQVADRIKAFHEAKMAQEMERQQQLQEINQLKTQPVFQVKDDPDLVVTNPETDFYYGHVDIDDIFANEFAHIEQIDDARDHQTMLAAFGSQGPQYPLLFNFKSNDQYYGSSEDLDELKEFMESLPPEIQEEPPVKTKKSKKRRKHKHTSQDDAE